ncbi:MAG TPA: hypothetical protein VGP77_02965, partial [Vicinamibacterales bacterium]|nr:hypothetical protein [Vicinamibacterales bacterium]
MRFVSPDRAGAQGAAALEPRRSARPAGAPPPAGQTGRGAGHEQERGPRRDPGPLAERGHGPRREGEVAPQRQAVLDHAVDVT